MEVLKKQIGNFVFTIYTQLHNIEIRFQDIKPNPLLPMKEIQIWMEDSEEKKKKLQTFCETKCRRFIPQELLYFNDEIKQQLQVPDCLINHVNRYYQKEDTIFACFPYVSDQFWLCYHKNKPMIYLLGNQDNLNRIILDFLSISNPYLPLHASGVGNGKQAICFMSDSNCGKTSILIKLLAKHFSFITDDSLFANQNHVFCANQQLCVRKQFPNHPVVEKLIQNKEKDKIYLEIKQLEKPMQFSVAKPLQEQQFYILQKEKQNWNGICDCKEPFPCISKHSFWCLSYIIPKNQQMWIREKIRNSVTFWNTKVKKAQRLTVDLNHLDHFTNELANKINKIDSYI